jgi:hypothetical protein
MFYTHVIIGNSIYDRRVPTRRIYDRRVPSICNIQEKFEDTKWIIRSRKSMDKTIQRSRNGKDSKLVWFYFVVYPSFFLFFFINIVLRTLHFRSGVIKNAGHSYLCYCMASRIQVLTNVYLPW